MLAHEYKKTENIIDWYASEKLDGVRAIWDYKNKQLLFRSNKKINAPKWFIENLPDMKLDGELWIDRGKFNLVSGMTRKKVPIDSEWKQIKYCVFDLIVPDKTYTERKEMYEPVLRELNIPHVVLVECITINNLEKLQNFKLNILSHKGEGVMLRNPKSFYEFKRSKNLLKYKEFTDGEVTLIGYENGSGKYDGLVGSLTVRNENGIVFNIGTGLDDNDRKNPPPIGSIIKYKYFDDPLRHPVYIGIRED